MTVAIACSCCECGREFSAVPSGGHRLLCGDATSEADVARALAGVTPHLMVTDPPYGVDYDPNWRAYRKGLWTEGYSVASGKVENDTRSNWQEAWALFPGHVAYVWHAALHEADVVASMTACEFEMRAQIVWVKPRVVISRGHYNWQHEPCLYAVRRGGTAHWAGDKGGDSTIWEIAQGRSTETGHGTQKPVECMRRPIENNSSPGHAVYDPFVGSGTSIIAAEMTGRSCHAIEISPAYVDVGVQRWQNFTGQAATLDNDGRTFAEIAEARGNA